MALWMSRLHRTARFRGRELQTNGEQVCFWREEHVPLFISSFNLWIAMYFGLAIFNIPAKNNSPTVLWAMCMQSTGTIAVNFTPYVLLSRGNIKSEVMLLLLGARIV